MILVTHNGKFHNDEVLATAILMMALPSRPEIIRTRDISKYEEIPNVIIYDVGMRYDGNRFFDHHQKDFSETFSEEFKTPMSSAGMIWKKFGRSLCSDQAWESVYRDFIYPVDCQDNGVLIDKSTEFQITGWNPTWEESEKEGIEDGRFWEATDVVSRFLRKAIERAESTTRAYSLVDGYIKSSRERGSRILVLEKFVPYNEFLTGEENFLFVIYPSQKKGCWRIQTLPDASGVQFQSKKQLPAAWVENLPEGMTFCHKGLFICEVTSFQRAIELAQEAILTP